MTMLHYVSLADYSHTAHEDMKDLTGGSITLGTSALGVT